MRPSFALLVLTALASSPALAASLYDLTETSAHQSPTLVFVHGGAWITGDKVDYKYLGEKFQREGFCEVNVNYTLAPVAMHPQPVKDLESVLEELGKKTSDHCDFSRLFLMGHSAGAHVIAFWATAYSNPAVKGMIGLEGIYDLPNLAETRPTYPNWFLKKEFGLSPAWALDSPTRLPFQEKAPWLLVQSLQDELIDQAQTTDFAAHLKKLGLPVETVLLPQERHDEVIRKLGTIDEESTKQVLRFLRKTK